jgi:hypothetical protein
MVVGFLAETPHRMKLDLRRTRHEAEADLWKRGNAVRVDMAKRGLPLASSIAWATSGDVCIAEK